MRKATSSFFLAGVLLLGASAVHADTYTVDAEHTAVSFKIRHLFTKVQGRFNEFAGDFVYDPDQPETWSVNLVVQAGSIDTNESNRDKHLRSADFFDTEQFPTLSFKSTDVTDITLEGAKLHGNLIIHGVQKPVVFDLEMHGVGQDPWGNQRSGFTATATINREDFGLTWNKALETGNLLVVEEVQIVLEVEGIAN